MVGSRVGKGAGWGGGARVHMKYVIVYKREGSEGWTYQVSVREVFKKIHLIVSGKDKVRCGVSDIQI